MASSRRRDDAAISLAGYVIGMLIDTSGLNLGPEVTAALRERAEKVRETQGLDPVDYTAHRIQQAAE